MRNYLLILWCVGLSLFILGCERAPSKSQLMGTYTGSLNGASEVLVLLPDGTFSQKLTLPGGKKVSASGTWQLDYKAVTFDRYQKFYSEEKHGALITPEPRYGVIYKWGSDMLIRDLGSGCYTLKHM